MLLAGPVSAQRLAFPGAEGAGKFTSGGRGNSNAPTTVYEVISLADTNTPGTLRYALSQSTTTAPHRTVVFRVCGTIRLTSQLNIPRNTTLAGQTAPGDGICVSDKQVSISGDNVIVRFMRFRLGDRYQNLGMVDGSGHEDAFGAYRRKNIVVDHCTMSWSNDEAFSVYAGDSTTLQWNLISEPLNYSYHFETGAPDYQQHGYGGIWGGRHASFHHNLFAHCQGRSARFDGSLNLPPGTLGQENCDFRNNVVYNWGSYTADGGAGGNYNFINNYYKSGPSTSNSTKSGVARRFAIIQPSLGTTTPVLPYGRYYLSGNYVEGSPAVTRNNWLGAAMGNGPQTDTAQAKATAPFPLMPLPTQTAQAAYTSVLQNVGCVLPVRDALDARIINDVRNRTGAIIDVQGGYPHGTPYAQTTSAWPTLTCGAAPTDTDHDGMPDTWETSHGLNPGNAADRQNLAANGYTNLENYLNGLVATVLSAKPTGAVPGLQVYPNPVRSRLTVTHPPARPGARVSVYTFLGQQVAALTPTTGGQETQFELGNLAKGNYLIVFADAETHGSCQFVRE